MYEPIPPFVRTFSMVNYLVNVKYDIFDAIYGVKKLKYI